MGDNIYLGDRNGVRTPMQWSPDRNAGFSRADPQRLYLPPIMDPIYGYEAVNVEAQLREPVVAAQLDAAHARGAQASSRRSAAARSPSCARATARSSPTCASYERRGDPVRRQPRARGAAGRARPRALQGPRAGRAARPHAVSADRRAALPADAAGARLLLVPARDRRAGAGLARASRSSPRSCRCWCCSTAGRASSATASCRGASAWPRRCAHQLETDVLPRFVGSAALVCGEGRGRSRRVEIADHRRCGSRRRAHGSSRSRASKRRRESHAYFLPLALAWEDATRSARARAVAVRHRARCASRRRSACWPTRSATSRFVPRGRRRDRRGGELPKSARGTLRFRPTTRVRRPRRTGCRRASASRRRARTAATPSSALGDRLFLKGYRRLQVGVNPEVEIGRFLTEVARFRALRAGRRQRRLRRGRRAQPRRSRCSRGTCRTRATAGTTRSTTSSASSTTRRAKRRAARRRRRARRVSRRSRARSACARRSCIARLRSAAGDPAFDPEPLTPADVAQWTERVRDEALSALERLERRRNALDATLREAAERLLGQRDRLLERIARHARRSQRRAEDAHARRLSPGTGAARAERFRHHRLRGRAGAAARGAPRKHSPLQRRRRDAALVRLRAARSRSLEFTTERGDVRERVEAAGRQWRTQATRAFLDGYDEIARARHSRFRARGSAGLLELFVLEKALYELRYEADNRPDWLAHSARRPARRSSTRRDRRAAGRVKRSATFALSSMGERHG